MYCEGQHAAPRCVALRLNMQTRVSSDKRTSRRLNKPARSNRRFWSGKLPPVRLRRTNMQHLFLPARSASLCLEQTVFCSRIGTVDDCARRIMKNFMQVSLFSALVISLGSTALAQTPAFDPRDWQSSLASKPTQVLTLGSPHLSQIATTVNDALMSRPARQASCVPS